MIVFLLSLLLPLASVAASDDSPEVIVSGLTSLDPDVVAQMSGVTQDSSLTAEEIAKRLETSGLFALVQVRRTRDYVYIRLRQKTTWFVVPVFSKDSAVTSYGIIVGKTIILGEDSIAIGQLQTGSGDQKIDLLFGDHAVAGSPWIAGVSAGYEDTIHRVYQGQDIVQQLTFQSQGGSVLAGYHLDPLWSIEMDSFFERHRFQESDGGFTAGIQVSHQLAARYERMHRRRGMAYGNSLKAFFEFTNPLSAFDFLKIGAESEASLFHHGDFAWLLRSGAVFSPRLPQFQLAELGGDSLRGFPSQQFRDRGYIIAQNDIFLTSTQLWLSTLRTLAFVDLAFIQADLRGSAGLGLQLNIQDVTVPAMQFYVGYGVNPSGLNATVAIAKQL